MSDSEEVASGKQHRLSGDDLGQKDGASSKSPAMYDLHSVEEFLSVIAHDLKGPLSVILIHAQLAQRELEDIQLRDGSRLPDHVAGVVSMCQRMAGLIEDLLDVTRAQMGQPVTVTLRPTDLVDLVSRVMERQPRRVESPLEFNPYPLPLAIQADVPRLERLVGNLVSNAMKVAAVDAPVAVAIDRLENNLGAWAVVTIAITGPEPVTIPWRMMLERFTLFSMDGGARDSLGLTWLGATQVMAQHHGALEVQTSGDATLVLHFPLIS
jgi:signal transduction histidine kinase